MFVLPGPGSGTPRFVIPGLGKDWSCVMGCGGCTCCSCTCGSSWGTCKSRGCRCGCVTATATAPTAPYPEAAVMDGEAKTSAPHPQPQHATAATVQPLPYISPGQARASALPSQQRNRRGKTRRTWHTRPQERFSAQSWLWAGRQTCKLSLFSC